MEKDAEDGSYLKIALIKKLPRTGFEPGSSAGSTLSTLLQPAVAQSSVTRW